jgi:penicillin-binding protein 1A
MGRGGRHGVGGPGARRRRPPVPAFRRRDPELLRLLARVDLRGRRPRSGAAVAALAVLASVIAIAVATAVAAPAIVSADCSLSSMHPLTLGQSSFVFASDGSLLGVIPSARNREPLPLSQISAWLPKATVAIEDRRFYQHGGLDYVAILRAAIADLKAGRIVQGGSTIEQELARNLYIGNDRKTLSRKLEEACLANKIAQRWSRATILDVYLNQLFYGEHSYGPQAAAETYFDRPASRLTLGQAALLAGLPQLPTAYDPLRHPMRARARRNEVLLAMLQMHWISERNYRHAAAQPLGLHPGRRYTQVEQPTFMSYVERELIARFGRRRVEEGGLTVKTTVDPAMQRLARQAIAGILKTPGDPAAALVAIDPRTGAVKALTAYQPGHRTSVFNLATQGHRQVGSAFKPFTLAAALANGVVSLYSSFAGPGELTIPDPRCSTNLQPWQVHNFGGESFGTIDVLTATANSVNTVYAQIVDEVGPATVVRVAHAMGIRSPLQAVCSITLGSQAVTPLEMTDAYATLAADGVHHPAQPLALVRAPSGDVLAGLRTIGTRAIPANVAAQVSYALTGVVQYGTGTAANIGRPVAGKTGTTENEQDAWFCGYVPQLTTCVWVGYPQAEIPLQNIEGVGVVVGGTLPAEIWHAFMAAALASTPVENFPPYTITGVTNPAQGPYAGYSSSYAASPYGSSSSTTTSGATTTPVTATGSATTTTGSGGTSTSGGTTTTAAAATAPPAGTTATG